MTKAEACLWKFVLSKQQMANHSFRRQRPVLNYIADFMCIESKLIIEVDGLTHHWDEVGERDVIRRKQLEVLNTIDEVRRRIYRYVEEL